MPTRMSTATLLALLIPISAYAQDVNSQLVEAAQNGQTEKVEELLEAGANVNAKDKAGLTVLMRTINSDHINEGYTDTINLLLDKGVDVNAQDEEGITALMHVAKGPTAWGSLNIGGNFVITGPPGGRSLLEQVYLEVVQALLAKGADVNTRDKEGITALMRAASVGYTAVGRTLIEGGADVNVKNENGGSALMYGAAHGDIETVELLLAKGAGVNTQDGNGWTALIVAALEGHTDISQALLDAGADVNAETAQGDTALTFARAQGHHEVLQLLQNAGANDVGGSALTKTLEEAEAYYTQGKTHLQNGQYDQGIADFAKAIELNPAMVDAYVEMAFANLQKGDFDSAISDSTRAIEIAPDYPLPYINRGSAYANKGEFDQAIADFTKAIELDPTLAQAYANLGASYERIGNVRQSAEAYEKAFKLGLSNATLFNNLAWLFATTTDSEIRNPEKAIEYASQAVEATNGRNPGFLDTLAEAYYTSNDFEKAIQTIQQAIALQPNESYYKEQLIKFQEGGQAEPKD